MARKGKIDEIGRRSRKKMDEVREEEVAFDQFKFAVFSYPLCDSLSTIRYNLLLFHGLLKLADIQLPINKSVKDI